MSQPIDPNGQAFPGDRGPLGLTIRAYVASEVMNAMISASYGEEGYSPRLADGDFFPDEQGTWHKSKYGWVNGNAPHEAKRFRYIGTLEKRFARDAVAYADALIDELNGRPNDHVGTPFLERNEQ